MKKLFFALAVLLSCSLAANAQKVIDSTYDLETIPWFFTYNRQTFLFSYKSENYCITECTIYDMNLDKVETLLPKDKIDTKDDGVNLRQYIDKNGLSNDIESRTFYLTQTLFNDDADWEYIVPEYEEVATQWGTYKKLVSHTIKKIDGTVVGTISIDKWSGSISVINDVIYAIRSDADNDLSYYYTTPEFRKLISGDPSSVEAVPAMVKHGSKEAYNLSGRRVSERHSGVVIKNGQKMLMK